MLDGGLEDTPTSEDEDGAGMPAVDGKGGVGGVGGLAIRCQGTAGRSEGACEMAGRADGGGSVELARQCTGKLSDPD